MLGEGMHVADIGAGSGAYTLWAAEAVGENGRVYAIDVQQPLLDRIKKAAIAQGMHTIEALRGNVEAPGGTHLGDDSVDACIVTNILFLLEDKNALVLEVKRILKASGKVLVVDWSDSFGGLGPQKKDIITFEEAQKIFRRNNFDVQAQIEAGEHHWGCIVKQQSV